MKKRLYQKYTENILYSKNIFSILCVLLTVALIIVSSFLFLKNERIIVTPAVIEKEFWVENNQVSATYLEQYGVFLGQLLLSKSIYSAPMQRQILMRHTTPFFVDKLRKKLFEEENLLKKQNASYMFFPITVRVDPKNLKVVLTGDRQMYIGSKITSSQRESYELAFSLTSGRLMLQEIKAKEEINE